MAWADRRGRARGGAIAKPWGADGLKAPGSSSVGSGEAGSKYGVSPGEDLPYILLSSSARLDAALTAFMKAARTPAFSSSCTPAMVVPEKGKRTWGRR